MNSIEHTVWQSIGEGWRHLYGSMRSLGVSIELHDFLSDTVLDWGKSFHTDSVEICLNIMGRGEVEADGTVTRFNAGTVGYYVQALEPLRAMRAAKERHYFLTVELSHAWLMRVLSSHEKVVGTLLRETLFANPPRGGVGTARPMTRVHEEIAASLARPPVGMAARALWFEAKVLELLSLLIFADSDEFFCDRQKRVARSRVERAREILSLRLANPPSLDELAREVGISGFYLSRTFSQEMGMSIPQFIRRTRIERAAEFLRAGRYNVSEAAFAVGYSSLGHFSKSFFDIMGITPALYAQARDTNLQDTDSV